MKNFSIKPYFAAILTLCTVLTITTILNRSEEERFQEQTRANVVDRLSTKRAHLEAALNQRTFLGRGKDEFLANTSHELSTPLNGIIGLAESLIYGATGQLPESTRTNLAMIVSSGRRLASLVNDI